MLDSNSLEQVKQYNATLKQYRAKSAQLNAEIEYINKEIDTLCAELTAELGVAVTKENVEQICKEQSDKILTSLQSGNAVLAKIASEEQGATPVAQPVAQPVTQQVVQPTPVAPVAPTPVASAPITPVAPTVTPAVAPAVPGSVFNGQDDKLPEPTSSTALPPLFSLG